MAGAAASRALGVFECQLCALTAPYGYRGQQPPDAPAVLLLEESYVSKDPFTPDKDRFLVLGSRCSVCGRLVCVGPVGVQLVLHQEILPPLCAGEHRCFPPGNSARLGETEGSIKETCQPARLPGLTQGCQVPEGPGLLDPSPVCFDLELGSDLQQRRGGVHRTVSIGAPLGPPGLRSSSLQRGRGQAEGRHRGEACRPVLSPPRVQGLQRFLASGVGFREPHCPAGSMDTATKGLWGRLGRLRGYLGGYVAPMPTGVSLFPDAGLLLSWLGHGTPGGICVGRQVCDGWAGPPSQAWMGFLWTTPCACN